MTHLTEETQAKQDERRDRLAAQLRANLARRKQQSRRRDAEEIAPARDAAPDITEETR